MTQAAAIDDRSLLAAYAGKGDPEAFAELARRYASLVLSVAQRITRSPHDAEDITQTCFLDLAKNAHAVSSIPGYLHRAATTRALNLIRDNKTRRAYEAKSPVQSPDLTYQELMPMVDTAINELPDDLRIPLILHYQQSKSQAEIATQLKMSQPTVSRRLDSAIAELRRHLSRMGEGAGVAAGGISGISAAVATVALRQTAAPPPPAALLSSLNKIGLAGVGHTAVASVPIAKLITLVCCTTLFALAILYFFPHGKSPSPPSVSATPSTIVPFPASTPVAESSSSSSDTPGQAPNTPPQPHQPSLLQLNYWSALYPNATAAISADGSYFVTASNLHAEITPAGNDNATSLALYSTATHERLQNFPGHSRYITAVAISPDGNLVASASRDGTVRIWDPLTGDEVHHFQIPSGWFTAIAFSHDSQFLYAAAAFNMDKNPATPSSSLYEFQLESERTLTPFAPFDHTLITALAVSPDNTTLAIATRDADVALYQLSPAKLQSTLDKTANTHALLFSDSTHLFTGSDTLTLWDVASKTQQAAFPIPATSLTLSNSSALLATSPNGELHLYQFKK